MDRHLLIMNSFLHIATLRESKLILFHQQSGALQKQLLFLSFWCVLMALISSGMLLAPGDSDVSATIAVRKHWWWIYNIQAPSLWPEKWLSICFWSKIGFNHTKKKKKKKKKLLNFLPVYFNETFYLAYKSCLLPGEVFSMRSIWGS